MKKIDKDSLIYIAVKSWKDDFWLKMLTFTSIGLMITSFFLPPTGVIDPSVMAGIGELTAIGALWQFTKCINKNITAKVKIHEIELELTRTKKGLPEHELDDKNIEEE